MASLPNITYDMLKQFYLKYKPKPLEEEFTIIDLEGTTIGAGWDKIFTGKNFVNRIKAEKKPVLFTNFKIGETTYSYSFGTYETRYRKQPGDQVCEFLIWKIYDGMFIMHNWYYASEGKEYLMYFPRCAKLTSVLQYKDNSLSVNNTLTFKQSPAPTYSLYYNKLELRPADTDQFIFAVLKIQVIDDTDEKWARCSTTNDGVNTTIKWVDNRTGWSNDISKYSVCVF